MGTAFSDADWRARHPLWCRRRRPSFCMRLNDQLTSQTPGQDIFPQGERSDKMRYFVAILTSAYIIV